MGTPKPAVATPVQPGRRATRHQVSQLADQAFLLLALTMALTSATLLERLQELLDLFDAKAALTTGGAV